MGIKETSNKQAPDIKKVITSHNKTGKQNDLIVSDSLNNQNDRLMEKLRVRREKSISRSISRGRISMDRNSRDSGQNKKFDGQPVFKN